LGVFNGFKEFHGEPPPLITSHQGFLAVHWVFIVFCWAYMGFNEFHVEPHPILTSHQGFLKVLLVFKCFYLLLWVLGNSMGSRFFSSQATKGF
jgi:hypothetical protein